MIKAYESVNKEFALKTLDALRQVDRRLKRESDTSVPIIWIHDYHLMLAATMIRQVALAGFSSVINERYLN